MPVSTGLWELSGLLTLFFVLRLSGLMTAIFKSPNTKKYGGVININAKNTF